MPTNPQVSTGVQRMLDRYERRIQGLKVVRDILESDPGFGQELAKLLGDGTNGHRQQSDGGSVPPTQFGQIQAYFGKIGNRWQSAPEIIRGAGLSRGAVGQALYRSHPDRFEHKRNPKRKGGKLWRMKMNG